MDAETFLLCLAEGLEPWEEVAARAQLPVDQARLLAHALSQRGYPVRVEECGVGLAPDSLAPHHVLPRLRGRLGRPYRYLGTVTSTQDVLRSWYEAPEGAVVAAERQTQGRGRLGRPWLSLPGNLCFSLLLCGPLPRLLPLRAGLALAQAAGFGLLKWPNDLLSPDGRKLGGILIETEGNRAFLGVGVNVAQAPLPTAAALREFRAVKRAELLADFLAFLEEWLAQPPSAVHQAWQKLDGTLGREVRVHTPTGVVEGVAEAISPEGALLVRTATGMKLVRVGDVVLSPPPNVVNAQESQG